MNGPIIRGPRRRPAGTDGYRVPLVLTVEGGLQMIRGNHAPYFSLTYTQHRSGHPNQCWSGGAGHDLILKLYPELADLAALHLSDIDGVPMHAEANGWYWLAGALGGLGETYHGSSREGYGPHRSEADSLALFARHCRITYDEARSIELRVLVAYGDHDEQEGGVEERRAAARAEWARIMETMKPRWKAEAEAAIERHGLKVYGDPWTPNTEEVPA